MDKLKEAFEMYDRINFVGPDMRRLAHVNQALPIGHGQTISQPSTVEMMLEWLDVQPGDRVLDVGSGSGWTTALLSRLAGPRGLIYAVELIPELLEFGRQNCERAGVKNASFHQAGASYGLPAEAPFDRILVSASADHLPKELVSQLKPGGKMIIPVHEDIIEITKKPDGQIKTKTHPGFVFVPLL